MGGGLRCCRLCVAWAHMSVLMWTRGVHALSTLTTSVLKCKCQVESLKCEVECANACGCGTARFNKGHPLTCGRPTHVCHRFRSFCPAVNTVVLSFPIFGTAYYWSQWLFCAVFLISVGVCPKPLCVRRPLGLSSHAPINAQARLPRSPGGGHHYYAPPPPLVRHKGIACLEGVLVWSREWCRAIVRCGMGLTKGGLQRGTGRPLGLVAGGGVVDTPSPRKPRFVEWAAAIPRGRESAQSKPPANVPQGVFSVRQSLGAGPQAPCITGAGR